jgi:disulfide bond formation protein DsbB
MLYKHQDIKTALPLTLRNAALFIAAASAVILAGAWIIELVGYKPCPLCLEERMAYYAAVPAGLIAAAMASSAPRLTLMILTAVCLGFVYNSGLGVYHAGAEWHLWKGPETCTGDAIQVTGSLARMLQHNTGVRCDEAALRILGVSLAGYNAVISAALAVFLGWAVAREVMPAIKPE